MQIINLENGKVAEAYVVDFKEVSLVYARTDIGFIGCGVFDVAVLDKFGCPAAKVSAQKGLITSVDDLLEGYVVEVNKTAEKLGIELEMTGIEALELL